MSESIFDSSDTDGTLFDVLHRVFTVWQEDIPFVDVDDAALGFKLICRNREELAEIVEPTTIELATRLSLIG